MKAVGPNLLWALRRCPCETSARTGRVDAICKSINMTRTIKTRQIRLMSRHVASLAGGGEKMDIRSRLLDFSGSCEPPSPPLTARVNVATFGDDHADFRRARRTVEQSISTQGFSLEDCVAFNATSSNLVDKDMGHPRNCLLASCYGRLWHPVYLTQGQGEGQRSTPTHNPGSTKTRP